MALANKGEEEGHGVGGPAFNISTRFNVIIHSLLAGEGRKVARCLTR